VLHSIVFDLTVRATRMRLRLSSLGPSHPWSLTKTSPWSRCGKFEIGGGAEVSVFHAVASTGKVCRHCLSLGAW
jgi:hypothetical protein